jgi:hypothetical protein
MRLGLLVGPRPNNSFKPKTNRYAIVFGLIQALGGCVEHYITASEIALLLAVFWLPVFILAAVPQWRFLAARSNRLAWLVAAFLLECVLAFAVWLSPLHRYFFDLGFLDGLSMGSIPLQAAVLAAMAVTFLIWAVARVVPRPAP